MSWETAAAMYGVVLGALLVFGTGIGSAMGFAGILGVSLVSGFALWPTLGDIVWNTTNSFTLVAVPLNPRLTRELTMVYAPEKFRSKLLDAFISFVENKFQQCNIDVVPLKRPVKGRGR